MTEKCVVCKTEINPSDAKCPVCGFADLHKDFISKEDAENWMKTVVEPYREKYNESLRKSQSPKYDAQGFDIDVYNKYGFNRIGYNCEGFDKAGYDHSGYNKEGFNKITGLNHEGYAGQGYSNSGYREPECKNIEDILVPIRVACLVIFLILLFIDTIPFWVPLIPVFVIVFINTRYENK